MPGLGPDLRRDERRKGPAEITPDPPCRFAGDITAVPDSAGAITQDSFSFDRLERLYGAIARTVLHAYGQASARP